MKKQINVHFLLQVNPKFYKNNSFAWIVFHRRSLEYAVSVLNNAMLTIMLNFLEEVDFIANAPYVVISANLKESKIPASIDV